MAGYHYNKVPGGHAHAEGIVQSDEEIDSPPNRIPSDGMYWTSESGWTIPNSVCARHLLYQLTNHRQESERILLRPSPLRWGTLGAQIHCRNKTLGPLLPHGTSPPPRDIITTSILCHFPGDANSWPLHHPRMISHPDHTQPPRCCLRLQRSTPSIPFLTRTRTRTGTARNPNPNHHPSARNQNLQNSDSLLPMHPYRLPHPTHQGQWGWEYLPPRP